jgi:hypothetical protein
MIKQVSLQMVTDLYGNEILTAFSGPRTGGLNPRLYAKADYL